MEPKPKRKNIKKRGRQLTESAILVAVGMVFILIGNYIPIVSLLLFLSAVPVVVVTYRNGIGFGAMSGLVMAILLAVFVHPLSSITMYIVFFIPGSLMGYSMRRHQEPFRNIFYGWMAIVIALIVYTKILNLFFDFNILDSMKSSIDEYMTFQKNYMQGMSIDAAQLLQAIEMFFPALLMMFSITLSFLTYYASASLMRRLGEKRRLGVIREFSLPGNVPIGLMLVYLVVYIFYWMHSPYYEVIKNNALAVFSLLFFLQGWAVVSYFIHYMRLPGFAKTLILGSLIFVAPVSGFVFLIGLVDTAFNFRRLSRL